MVKPAATYREKIQELIKLSQSIYDDAEWLRDMATDEEKKYWNEVRKNYYDACTPLRKLDNSLSSQRAATKI